MSQNTQPTPDAFLTGSEGDEETDFQAILERLDETGERISQSLGRIHWLMRDIVGELQTARGGTGSKAE